MAFSHLIGALKSPRNLNGYGADYAPNTKYKCELIIKRADTFDQAIIISIDAGSCHVDVTSLDNRIVELEAYNEESLMTLQDNAIGEGRATFLNFKKNNSGTVDRTEIDRGIEKFKLFSSGKYHLDIVSCSEINNRKRSTVCEIIFAEQLSAIQFSKLPFWIFGKMDF